MCDWRQFLRRVRHRLCKFRRLPRACRTLRISSQCWSRVQVARDPQVSFLPRLSLFVFYLSLLGTPCAVVVFVMPFLQVRVVPPSTCGGVFGFDTEGMRYKQADRLQTQIGQIALRRIGGPIDAASEHRAGQSRNRGTVAQVT